MSILITSMPVANNGEEIIKVSYIHYPVKFQKVQEQIKTPLNSGSKINTINPDFAWKLGFYI